MGEHGYDADAVDDYQSMGAVEAAAKFKLLERRQSGPLRSHLGDDEILMFVHVEDALALEVHQVDLIFFGEPPVVMFGPKLIGSIAADLATNLIALTVKVPF